MKQHRIFSGRIQCVPFWVEKLRVSGSQRVARISMESKSGEGMPIQDTEHVGLQRRQSYFPSQLVFGYRLV